MNHNLIIFHYGGHINVKLVRVKNVKAEGLVVPFNFV